MVYRYNPRGVCSKEFVIDLDGDTIKHVQIIGGCPGNTQGVCKLIEGMKVKDVIAKLKGINCRGRGTSCPDQLAEALEKIMCQRGRFLLTHNLSLLTQKI